MVGRHEAHGCWVTCVVVVVVETTGGGGIVVVDCSGVVVRVTGGSEQPASAAVPASRARLSARVKRDVTYGMICLQVKRRGRAGRVRPHVRRRRIGPMGAGTARRP